MKTTSFSLILPVFMLISNLTGLKSQTNVYHPFPDSNAVWVVYYYHGHDLCERYEYSANTMTEDTTISGKIFHKIQKKGFVINVCSIPACTTYFDFYRGAIREDTTEKKVYYMEYGYSDELLLYDFNLQIGDTIKGYCFELIPFIVDSIDSVQVGSSYRKRYLSEHSYPVNLIEGIGGSGGLLDMPMTFEWGGTFICFKQDGQTLYNIWDVWNYDCDSLINIYTTVPEVKEDENNIIPLFPNFINGNFLINAGNTDFTELIFYNIFGQEICHYKLNNNNLEINTGNFVSGLYIYRFIKSNNKSINGKIIINKN